MLKDQKELLSVFNAHDVKYLLVGGHAVGLHAELRIWMSSPRRTLKMPCWWYRALAEFGAPVAGVTAEDFTEPDTVFQFGVPPGRIDVLQQIEGVSFDEAWEARVEAFVAEGIQAHLISREHLIRNKLAVGRHRDFDDVEKLRAAALVGGDRA